MRLTLKESIFKILIPVSGVVIVGILFNITTLTSERFFNIIISSLFISLAGGLLIYTISLLYDKYEKSVLEKIRKRYHGVAQTENIVAYTYKNLEVLCVRTPNFYKMQNEYRFHVPRKFIRKHDRKNINFIKPSRISNEEYFHIQSWLYITQKKLKKLEHKLDAIAALNDEDEG